MKAAVLKSFNQPLEICDVDSPRIMEEDDVLIHIVRTGVCYRDILTVEGFFPQVKPPIILGHEIAGVVEDVGPQVSSFRRGDKVVSLTYIFCGKCSYCLSGRENLCRSRKWFGEHINGSYAEYVVVKERSLQHIPDRVNWNQAAISACVIGMLIHALRDQAGIKEGDTVLITGAGGGVGIHAIQVAKAYGAKVIATTTSKHKVNAIWSVGADDVILVKEGRFSKTVKDRYGGVDVALEAVGEPTFQETLRSLKWGGKVIVIGNINVKPVSLALGLIILRENQVIGNISSTKSSLREALKLCREGKVKAIGEEMPLEKINEAHKKIKRKEVIGRVFISI